MLVCVCYWGCWLGAARNLRDRFCARSHTSRDAKLGIKVRDDVAAFGISTQSNCQDYTVHRMVLSQNEKSILFAVLLFTPRYLLNIR